MVGKNGTRVTITPWASSSCTMRGLGPWPSPHAWRSARAAWTGSAPTTPRADLAGREARQVDRRQMHPRLQGLHQLPDLLCERNCLGPLLRRHFPQAAEVDRRLGKFCWTCGFSVPPNGGLVRTTPRRSSPHRAVRPVLSRKKLNCTLPAAPARGSLPSAWLGSVKILVSRSAIGSAGATKRYEQLAAPPGGRERCGSHSRADRLPPCRRDRPQRPHSGRV